MKTHQKDFVLLRCAVYKGQNHNFVQPGDGMGRGEPRFTRPLSAFTLKVSLHNIWRI